MVDAVRERRKVMNDTRLPHFHWRASFVGVIWCVVAAFFVAEAASAQPSGPSDQFLDTTKARDVISPVGLSQTLCALAPGVRPELRRKLARIMGTCGRKLSYSETSVWLSSGRPIPKAVADEFARRSIVYRSKPPFNRQIAKWLRLHGVPAPAFGTSVDFASASAVYYSRDWVAAFQIQSIKRSFFGRHHNTVLSFMHGQGISDTPPGCRRFALPTEGGGFVMFAFQDDNPQAALRCLEKPMLRSTAVKILIPPLDLSSSFDWRSRLSGGDVGALFNANLNPFPQVYPHHGLSQLVQAVSIRLDEKGVMARAGTLADIALSAGGPFFKTIVLDKPFVFRVVDSNGDAVVLGAVSDLE